VVGWVGHAGLLVIAGDGVFAMGFVWGGGLGVGD
jgi:hypothetical protein